jgi:effector-binding domain-containing protein
MDFKIEELTAQPYMFIRQETKQSEIGNRIGACLGRLMPYVAANAGGMPIARWSKWEDGIGTMEVGIPVREPMPAKDEIEAGELPAGRAAVVTHVGSYDGLMGSWEKLKAWMQQEGLEGRADPWEAYVDDPGEVPVEKLRTIIHWPIRS